MFKQWTTFDDQGNIREITPGKIKYDPAIEEYTDYKYTWGQKVSTISEGVAQEAKKDLSKVGGFFDNVGQALSNTAKVGKYLPILAVAGGAYFVYKKAV